VPLAEDGAVSADGGPANGPFELNDDQAMRALDFALGCGPDDLPTEALARAQDLILDALGVAAAARSLRAAVIARETATRLFAAGSPADASRLLFDGRTVSVAGACYAAATQIDALDGHDGYAPCKGHAGVALVPALIHFADLAARRGRPVNGREALATLAVGYEIACRAGTALHATVTDYHTSGAWNALGVATVAGRLLRFDRTTLRHAWGIAEYHGPRSQMMREIRHASMLHDGSGWGALAGASAVMLAEAGFTGAPAVTVEGTSAVPHWRALGRDPMVLQQYVKPHPVCFWAQSVVTAALRLRKTHGLSAGDVAAAEIATFAASAALTAGRPRTTEEAHYSLVFPMAAALVRGRCGPAEVGPDGLADEVIAALIPRTRVVERPGFTRVFPGQRLSSLILTLRDGRVLDSGPVAPRGSLADPLDRPAIAAKFQSYAAPALGEGPAAAIRDSVFSLENTSLSPLVTLALASVP
jgi:2-methylcitrate dehydratase PrpD